MVEKTNGQAEPDLSSGDGASISKSEIEKMVNTAIGMRFRSFEEKQVSAFDKLEKLISESTKKPEEEALPAKPKKDQLMEALTNKLQILEQKDKRAREQHLRMKIQEELTGKVVPGLVKPLLAQFALENTVSYASEDADDILFKTSNGPLPLRDGIQEFLLSEDAKPFLPPKGVSGSGDKAYSQTHQAPKTTERFATREAAAEAFVAALSGE